MTLRQSIPSLLLFMAAAFSSWLVVASLKKPLATPDSPQNPDSFAVDTMATRMRATDGLPKEQLFTSLLVHYPQGDKTDITAPHLIIFNEDNKQPWHIYADKGQTQNGIAVLQLWDNVRLVQAASAQNPSLTAITSKLTIFPKKDYAETQQPVNLTHTLGTASAIGLHANFKTGVINLLAHVHGHYIPTPKTK